MSEVYLYSNSFLYFRELLQYQQLSIVYDGSHAVSSDHREGGVGL